MRILKDLFRLFYPDLCVGCQNTLLTNEFVLCLVCKYDLPIMDIQDFENNIITSNFYGRIPIYKAASFLFYRKDNITQKLIHQLKYNYSESIGVFLGNLFADLLKEKKTFSDVDCIIPVPLHLDKEKLRGYNQLTKFGETLSERLNIAYNTNTLYCDTLTKTQTSKKRYDRFSKLLDTFSIKNTTLLENKHILLIDDVITTGATLEACCNELLKTKNITISIATIAYTERY